MIYRMPTKSKSVIWCSTYSFYFLIIILISIITPSLSTTIHFIDTSVDRDHCFSFFVFYIWTCLLCVCVCVCMWECFDIIAVHTSIIIIQCTPTVVSSFWQYNIIYSPDESLLSLSHQHERILVLVRYVDAAAYALLLLFYVPSYPCTVCMVVSDDDEGILVLKEKRSMVCGRRSK